MSNAGMCEQEGLCVWYSLVGVIVKVEFVRVEFQCGEFQHDEFQCREFSQSKVGIFLIENEKTSNAVMCEQSDFETTWCVLCV